MRNTVEREYEKNLRNLLNLRFPKGGITTIEASFQWGCPPGTAAARMRALKELGLVFRAGKTHRARWVRKVKI